ncbi:MAG TPA: glycoside hydrolase family 76 protein [Solirubrobacteraceae bacterium]|nr:glycoside hydrolase family 76 protein [Solirubrobacteraceae bacterium]
MSSRLDHRLAPRTRLTALPLLALAVLACALMQVSPAPASAASPSPYPAGATRALRIAKPSELAHAAASAPTGGSTAPGASTAAGGSSKPASKHSKPKPKPKPVLHGDPARAVIAYEAMQRSYYIAGSGLYEGEPFSYLWSFSQALAATVTMSHVTGIATIPGLSGTFARELSARMSGLRSYLDTNNSGQPEGSFTSSLAAFDGTVAPPAGPGGTKYYDDNEWVGIELMRIYEATHNAATLGGAEAIMAFVMAGWDANPELACSGGVPFSNSTENTERNTVTDGPAAELALQLYRATANAAYLQFAQQAYEWTRRCVLSSNGLYADHIGPHGTVAEIYWSYNQGSMIGAGTLLYQATHNSAYLYQARQTAEAALEYFTPERLGSENPFFVSVYFRNMLYLDSVTHDPPGPKLAQPYVDYAWQHLRLADNLFVFGSPPSGQLLVQAAIVQIYGLLSSSPSTYF